MYSDTNTTNYVVKWGLMYPLGIKLAKIKGQARLYISEK